VASHSAGVKRGEFCAQRKKPCKDGKNYRTICAKPWTYQAHHVLCVASVTKFIGKKKEIQPIVKQTKWCINESFNMLAMPMWGTINKFYTAQIRVSSVAAAPPFANIPVHSYDHGLYQDELDTDLMALADKVQNSKKKHENAAKTLKGDLNSLASRYKNKKLLARGKRGKKTHQEWLQGLAGTPSKTWYMPFSMADAPEPRTFPARRKSVMEKVAKLIKSLF
jgi:hypothetical protein